MPSHHPQSSVLPLGELFAHEVKKFLRSPVALGALVLILMLIMILSALALGAWWDSNTAWLTGS